MNYKQSIIILLAMAVFVIFLDAVSLGFFGPLPGDDTNTTAPYAPVLPKDTLKNSSIKLKYAKSIKSTEYGHFYEDSDEFAEDAYWGQWLCKIKLTFDVEKLYKYAHGFNSSHTLEDFKKDLKYMVKHNDIHTSEPTLNGKYLYGGSYDYSSSLNNNCSELVIECDCNYADYSRDTIKDTISYQTCKNR